MKRQKPEQIVSLLHQFDAALAQGKTIEDICLGQGTIDLYQNWLTFSPGNVPQASAQYIPLLQFREKLHTVIAPQVQIAANMGFAGQWVYA